MKSRHPPRQSFLPLLDDVAFSFYWIYCTPMQFLQTMSMVNIPDDVVVVAVVVDFGELRGEIHAC